MDVHIELFGPEAVKTTQEKMMLSVIFYDEDPDGEGVCLTSAMGNLLVEATVDTEDWPALQSALQHQGATLICGRARRDP
jgi:hypothetical protein